MAVLKVRRAKAYEVRHHQVVHGAQMSETPGDFDFDIFDDMDEDVEQAELICTHKREKLFPQWYTIAISIERLKDMAAGSADINRDDKGAYLRDAEYQAEIQKLKVRFPNLLGFEPTIAKHLTWIGEYGSQLGRWFEKLPPERHAELRSPAAIKKAYEEDVAAKEAAAAH